MLLSNKVHVFVHRSVPHTALKLTVDAFVSHIHEMGGLMEDDQIIFHMMEIRFWSALPDRKS